ncbi:transposase-like protein [Hirsutella rhossiliensis]
MANGSLSDVHYKMLSSIHIVPDNWTSPNHLGVIGFTVQFVTEDHGLLSLVVRIKELQGQHSGENMAEAIMEFVREYGIASKIGYFMMDNASNMNTMIDKVSDDLEREFDVFYDPPASTSLFRPHHQSGGDGIPHRSQ